MTSPRFFYFDLGNVLLRVDHSIACRRVAAQTGLDETVVQSAIFDSGLQTLYEEGKISTDEFVARFVAATGKRVEPRAFLTQCSDIFDLNSAIVPVVAHLKLAGHRLGVLSNTCAAHWEFVSQGRFRVLQDLFEVLILSFEHGAMKPTSPIYEAAIDASGVVDPGEIFFTDDCPENVAGAVHAGLDATLFRGVQPLIEDLRQRQITTNL